MKIKNLLEDILVYLTGCALVVVMLGFCAVPFWLIYKICAGGFYLLDKLIDKI